VSAGLTEVTPHPWITTNAFFVSDDRKVIIKWHRPKKHHFSYYKYRALRLLGYPIPFEFRSEAARCAHEREIYAHWHAEGYKVPRLIDDPSIELPGPAAHCLVLEFIEGQDLNVLLADEGLERGQRLETVARLFAETDRRHRQVFARRDRRLIKYDANLRNIIVRDGELIHVDFECGRIAETLERGAAREIARCAVDAIKALGVSSGAEIAGLLRRTYSHANVLDKVIARGDGKVASPEGKFATADLARLLRR
jgi:tRNA A-37 threonylcarbamoyl transferase component Bud32